MTARHAKITESKAERKETSALLYMITTQREASWLMIFNWSLERSYFMRLQIQEEQKQIQRQQINILYKILELSASE